MSAKLIIAAVIVVAAVAVVAVTGGAALAALPAALSGSLGFGSALLASTAVSAVLWAGSTLLGALAPTPKVTANQGTELQTTYNPQSGVPVVYGDTVTGGVLSYWKSWGPKNVSLDMMAVLSACGPVEQITQTYLGDSQFVGNFEIDPTNGNSFLRSLTPAPAGKDGSMLYKNYLTNLYVPDGAGDPFTVRAGFHGNTATDKNGLMPGQDSNFLLSGLAYVGSVYFYDTNAWPGGAPAKQLYRVKGARVYDPRADDTYIGGGQGAQRVHQYGTYRYSNNPALCALHYLLGRKQNGNSYAGCGVPIESIDIPAFVDWANHCDANGWTCGGVTMSTDAKFDTFNALAQAGSGRLADRASMLSVVFDAPKTSVFTIDQNDIVGEVTTTNTASTATRYNRIVPTYREPNQKWNNIAGELITVDKWVTEDRGQTRTLEPTYGFIQDAAQAHQVAAYQLCNAREFEGATLTCKPRLVGAQVGDVVTVNLPDLDLNGQTMTVTARTVDPASAHVMLTLISETASKHAFALGQSQTAPDSPALTAGTYDPTNPDPPATYSVETGAGWTVAGGVTEAGGVTVPALFVTGSCDDDPTAASVIVEYRRDGTDTWTAWAEAPAKTTEAFTLSGGDIVDKGVFDVAISYRGVSKVITPRRILGPVTAGAYVIDYTSDAIKNKPPSLLGANGTILPIYLDPDVVNQANAVATVIAESDALRANVAATVKSNDDLAMAELLNAVSAYEEQSVRARDTYLAGKPIGPIVQSTTSKTDANVSFLNILGFKTADGGAIVLNTQNVWVDGSGNTFANTVTYLSSQTAGAYAAANAATTVATNANAATALRIDGLSTALGNAWSDFASNVALLTTNAASLANSITSLQTVVGQNRADFISNVSLITTNASSMGSKIDLLTAQVVGANAAIVSSANVAATATTALGNELHLAGGKTADGTAFLMNTNQFLISPTQSFAGFTNEVRSTFSGQIGSYVLSQASAGATKANAIGDALNAIGVNYQNAYASAIDSTHIVAGPGESLATRLITIKSSLDATPTSDSVSGQIDSKITVAVAPGGAVASKIDVVQAQIGPDFGTSSISSTVSALKGAVNSALQLQVTSGDLQSGGIATIRLAATGATSQIKLLADNIYFGANSQYEYATGTMHYYAGSVTNVFGSGFGSSGDLLQWFGPNNVGTGGMNRNNAYFYVTSDAKVGGPGLPSAGGGATAGVKDVQAPWFGGTVVSTTVNCTTAGYLKIYCQFPTRSNVQAQGGYNLYINNQQCGGGSWTSYGTEAGPNGSYYELGFTGSGESARIQVPAGNIPIAILSSTSNNSMSSQDYGTYSIEFFPILN